MRRSKSSLSYHLYSVKTFVMGVLSFQDGQVPIDYRLPQVQLIVLWGNYYGSFMTQTVNYGGLCSVVSLVNTPTTSSSFHV